MIDFSVVLIALASVAAIAGGVFTFIQFRTAGRGSFLKERNEELATAYEQVQQQRDNDRDENRREVQQLRDQVNQLRGEVAAHRVQYAEVIARAVVKALEQSGWVKGSTT